MNRLLLIYAAVIFIASVVCFTIGQLNKGTVEEPEKYEVYKWMRIFSIIGAILAIACFIAARNVG